MKRKDDIKDQSVGPPWSYDENHFQIYGTKLTTKGLVTICEMKYRYDNEEQPLFYAFPEMVAEFAREVVAYLNKEQVWLPDGRFHYRGFKG